MSVFVYNIGYGKARIYIAARSVLFRSIAIDNMHGFYCAVLYVYMPMCALFMAREHIKCDQVNSFWQKTGAWVLNNPYSSVRIQDQSAWQSFMFLFWCQCFNLFIYFSTILLIFAYMNLLKYRNILFVWLNYLFCFGFSGLKLAFWRPIKQNISANSIGFDFIQFFVYLLSERAIKCTK